jgi:hypothetical protein
VQTCHSSIVIFAFGNKKAIIAADSRVTHADGSYKDNACKIGSYGNNVVFAHVGLASFGIIDPMRQARQAVDDAESQTPLPGDDRSIAQRAAMLWRDRTVAAFQQLGFQQLLALATQNGSPQLAAFMFASADAGTSQISTWHATVTLTQGIFAMPGVEGLAEPYGVDSDEEIKLKALGHDQIFWEYAGGKTDRAKGWRQQVQAAQLPPERRLEQTVASLVDLTIHNDSNGVGGDVDEIDLKLDQGITWLHRKAACSASGEEITVQQTP